MFDVFLTYLPRLIRGAGTTLVISAAGISIGMLVGIVVGFCTAFQVRIISLFARSYVNFIRGTPLMVQILFLFFGIPSITKVAIPPIIAGILAIAANSGAYFSECIRGAVQSIHKNQIEAAKALGLSWPQIMLKIIWPQAFLVALPTLGNQAVTSLKDTSLLAVISVEELTRNGQIIIAATFRAFEIWLLVAILYLLLTSVFFVGVDRLESHVGKHRFH